VMGEAPPYTAQEIARLLDRATFKGVQRYDDNSVVFVLEEYGTANRIEVEVHADHDPDWESMNFCVYLRGVGD